MLWFSIRFFFVFVLSVIYCLESESPPLRPSIGLAPCAGLPRVDGRVLIGGYLFVKTKLIDSWRGLLFEVHGDCHCEVAGVVPAS